MRKVVSIGKKNYLLRKHKGENIVRVLYHPTTKHIKQQKKHYVSFQETYQEQYSISTHKALMIQGEVHHNITILPESSHNKTS